MQRCAYKFTGKERDTESGLDNFGKRYNASSLGRFMTPDPLQGWHKVWGSDLGQNAGNYRCSLRP